MFVEGPESETVMWVARSLAIQSSCKKFRASEPLFCFWVHFVVVVVVLFVCFVSVCNEN